MTDLKQTLIIGFIVALFVGLISFYTGWTVASWKAGKALAEEQATSEKLRSAITTQNAKIAILETESKAAQARIADALAANQARVKVVERVIEKNAPTAKVTRCDEVMPAVRNILEEIKP